MSFCSKSRASKFGMRDAQRLNPGAAQHPSANLEFPLSRKAKP